MRSSSVFDTNPKRKRGILSIPRLRFGLVLRRIRLCNAMLGHYLFLASNVTSEKVQAALKFGGGFAPYTINAPPALRAGMTKDTSPQCQQGTDRSCTNKIRSE